jgi:PAS domain S-box-containing protein
MTVIVKKRNEIFDRRGQFDVEIAPAESPMTDRGPAEPRPRGSWRRWWDDLPLRTKGIAVIGIPVVPLLVSALLFAIDARSASNAEAWVAHTTEVKAQIATVLVLNVDAEAGVRGFLLAPISESLHRYEDATAVVETAVQQLGALTADNLAQGDHLRTLAALMITRPLQRLLDYTRQHPDGPTPLALLAESRTTMAAVRGELAQMQEVEDRLLARRVIDARRAESALSSVSIFASLFGLVGGVIATFAFTNGVATRVDRLRENASRLAAGDALLPAVAARDEVGTLEQGIQDASRLLRARDDQVRGQIRDLAALNQELERARREIDQFFSLSLDLMCVAGPDGHFKRVNDAWGRSLGWTVDELTTTPFVNFVHPDDRAATLAETAKLAQGSVTVNFENRYRAKDGTYRWLNWSAVATLERGLLYAAARDVTEQKRAGVALQHHADELAAVNRELEAFSYSVAHDLRAPLRHVIGFASMLQRSAGHRLEDTETRHLRTIIDAGNSMGRLIDDLLAFSRMGRTALHRRRISLDAVVRDVLQELQGTATDREIAWTVHPLPDVIADPVMLRLAIVNLLSNAIKYTRGRTLATVEVGVDSGTPDETIVYVRDNGAGFDMKYAHKLFGVFQRLHNSDDFEGTGIGLANVRRIVQRHRGRVWAEGVVDGGATFFFSLPDTGDTP